MYLKDEYLGENIYRWKYRFILNLGPIYSVNYVFTQK